MIRNIRRRPLRMFVISSSLQTTSCRLGVKKNFFTFRLPLTQISPSSPNATTSYSSTFVSLLVPSRSVRLNQIHMAHGENESLKEKATPYEEVLDVLSSLITKRSRADKSNKGDRFELLFDYLKILDLEEAVLKMKIIHVAGTKGKGSTCTFTESILRNYGFRTGLFTSPHLIDIRERFRLDGVDISEEKFIGYFWWCYERLKENANEDVPMPTFFRFIALLAFKIFAAEQVDVAILEVGLGGKFDATNVVQKPVVCGISSLGFDHMEILGDTLGKIAGEKAGIFKHGIPVYTVPQPDEAMHVLVEKAAELDAKLEVAQPLTECSLMGRKLALDGEHQYLNAGLAIALATAWLQRTGNLGAAELSRMGNLSEQFVKGLTTASLQGRAQIVPDQFVEPEMSGDLVFYLDGAHSPESMEACGKWFSRVVKEENEMQTKNNQANGFSGSSDKILDTNHDTPCQKGCQQILLFNCMSVRDPMLLLPHLKNMCASHGVHFKKALFVPNISVYHKVGSNALPETDSEVDLSWQFTLQEVWESLVKGERGGVADNGDSLCENLKDDSGISVRNCENSAVFSSLPLAIKWLRSHVQRDTCVRLQVLVTGSLHLVGDVLRLIRK